MKILANFLMLELYRPYFLQVLKNFSFSKFFSKEKTNGYFEFCKKIDTIAPLDCSFDFEKKTNFYSIGLDENDKFVTYNLEYMNDNDYTFKLKGLVPVGSIIVDENAKVYGIVIKSKYYAENFTISSHTIALKMKHINSFDYVPIDQKKICSQLIASIKKLTVDVVQIPHEGYLFLSYYSINFLIHYI